MTVAIVVERVLPAVNACAARNGDGRAEVQGMDRGTMVDDWRRFWEQWCRPGLPITVPADAVPVLQDFVQLAPR